MSADRTQVLVVGGGPAGASAAWHCAQLGLDVVLLDRATFPRRKPCAEYVSPGATAMLERMGVMPLLAPLPTATLRGMTVYAPGGGRIEGRFAGELACANDSPHGEARGLGVRREVLDTMLLERVRGAGVDVREGLMVEQLLEEDGRITGVALRADRHADGHAVSAASPHIRADLVIGADGLRSVVARRLGLARATRWPRRYAFVAHFRGVLGMGEVGEMHVRGDTRTAGAHAGYVGLARVDTELTNVALVVPAHVAREAAGHPDAFLESWLDAHPVLAPRLQHAVRVSPTVTTGPFASHARRAYAAGAMLTGDAADFFDPFTGEGIHSALLGGPLLAPHAQDAVRAHSRDAHLHALRHYEAARQRTFAAKWRVERLIGAAVAVPALLNHAAGVLSRDQGLADLLVGATGGVVPPEMVLRPGTLWRFLTS